MGITFWMGLLWRRATVAWSLGCNSRWIWRVVGNNVNQLVAWFSDSKPWPDSLHFIWRRGETQEIYDPWVVLIYTIAAMTVGVVVSLCTQQTAEQKLSRLLRAHPHPSIEGEMIDKPCTLPEGVIAPNRTMFAPPLV